MWEEWSSIKGDDNTLPKEARPSLSAKCGKGGEEPSPSRESEGERARGGMCVQVMDDVRAPRRPLIQPILRRWTRNMRFHTHTLKKLSRAKESPLAPYLIVTSRRHERGTCGP